ncbi:MAG TPA: alpha/beta hydrolase [Roseateles sp.]|nr:alpha/beta hydrolase [Roseateles sp.]
MSRERTSLGGWLLRLVGLAVLGLAISLAAFRAPERPLESLVARWAPPPSDFLDLGGQLVHYRDEGPRHDPLPIVLLHGTAASLHTWEGWVAALKGGRRVISVDLPGFGLTGPSGDGDYSAAAYVRFVLALLDRLQLARVVLGGNSLGGQTAWELALQHPARVAALVLVDAGGHDFRPAAVPPGFRLARLPGVEWLLRGLLPRRVVEASVLEVYGTPAKVRPELVDRYFELTLREGNRAALVQRLRQLRPSLLIERLPELRQPTLILWGGRDRLIPPAYGEAFAKAIPGSRLQVFETLGHVPQEEDPAATVAVVADFLHSLKP